MPSSPINQGSIPSLVLSDEWVSAYVGMASLLLTIYKILLFNLKLFAAIPKPLGNLEFFYDFIFVSAIEKYCISKWVRIGIDDLSRMQCLAHMQYCEALADRLTLTLMLEKQTFIAVSRC